MQRQVVITGANRGLGLALCRSLKNSGFNVHAFCRKASDELVSLGVRIYEDVEIKTIDDRIFSCLENVSIDLLIHNAGIGLDDNLFATDAALVLEHFLVNAYGPYCLTKLLLPLMKNPSKIILISSRLGSIGNNDSGGDYGYRMSKAALNALGKNLSIDLKKQGITVGVLSPGKVDTDMLRSLGVTTGANPDLVAEKLMSVINQLNLEDSGSFIDLNGETIPW